MKASECAEQLRRIADDLDKIGEYDVYPSSVPIFVDTPEEAIEIRRRIGAKMDKRAFENYVILEREYGDTIVPIKLQVFVVRSGMCEKKQVGVQMVTKPDPTFKAPMMEVEEPIYEWECGPLYEALGTGREDE